VVNRPHRAAVIPIVRLVVRWVLVGDVRPVVVDSTVSVVASRVDFWHFNTHIIPIFLLCFLIGILVIGGLLIGQVPPVAGLILLIIGFIKRRELIHIVGPIFSGIR
jgi:hypothetical protein